jgi:protein-L-isoaspartate(D-aspartate) O-methyltransferase
MLDFAQARRNMVDSQVRTFDVTSIPILAAMDEVPRERFVPEGRESLAYIDLDVPVSDGIPGVEPRFMLKPMFLGRMVQALDLDPGARVLDVGGGLGYSAAVLSRAGAAVTLLESSEGLAEAARARLQAAGFPEVRVVSGPSEAGDPEGGSYDGILVNGLVEVRPQGLLDQLADGGRLICVEQTGRAGRATLYTRSGEAVGSRSVFDAGARLLKGFQAERGFVF